MQSIKVMLLVMYLQTTTFHHLQHPDPDLRDEEIKFELTGKLANAPSFIFLQNTISSHIFPKTPTAKFVAETNQFWSVILDCKFRNPGFQSRLPTPSQVK